MINDLEASILQSRKIREFLKNYSETQWTRVIKATIMYGIQELEKTQSSITRLSAKDLEDIVVLNESSLVESKTKSIDNKQKLPKVEKNSNKKEQDSIIESVRKREQDLSLKKAVFSQQRRSSSPQLKQPNYHFQNTFKTSADQRRRDMVVNSNGQEFESQRSSSLPVEGPKGLQKQKPSANWRQPAQSNFQRNGSRPHNRMFNEELNFEKRSKSLNPLIYPEWWGDQNETQEDANPYLANQNRPNSIKRKLKEGDNSLDRRLMEAKEAAAKIEQMFRDKANGQNFAVDKQFASQQQQPAYQQDPSRQSKESSLSPPPTQTYYHTQHEQEKLNKRQVPQQMNKENQIPNVKYQQIVQQHSPPRHSQVNIQQFKHPQEKQKKKKHQYDLKKNTNRAQQQIYQFRQQEQEKRQSVPGYLKNVESKIKDKVLQDKIKLQSDPIQHQKQPEIYVKEKNQQQYQHAQVKNHPQGNEVNSQNVALRRRKPEQQVHEYQQQNYMPQHAYQNQQQQFYRDQKHYEQQQNHKLSSKPVASQRQNVIQGPYPQQHIQNGNINVAEIADGFLNSPLMTQFSSEEENQTSYTPMSSEGKPKTITLQMSNNKGNQKQSVNTTNFVNQTITSNGEIIHRNQFSTYYHQNPVSYVQQEGESGFYSQGDFNQITMHNNQNNKSRGAINSAVGMTQILNNMNSEDQAYENQNQQYDSGNNQQYINQMNSDQSYEQQEQYYQGQTNYHQYQPAQSFDRYPPINGQEQDYKQDYRRSGAVGITRLENVPEEDTQITQLTSKNQSSQPLTNKLVNPPQLLNDNSRNYYMNDSQQHSSPKIDQYNQITHQVQNNYQQQPMAHGQSQINPFQTKKYLNAPSQLQQQQHQVNPITSSHSNFNHIELKHRATASQPFNYVPQQSKNNQHVQGSTYNMSSQYNESLAFSPSNHPREDLNYQNNIQSPMSDDPNAFSQKFYNPHGQSNIGMTQILQRNNSKFSQQQNQYCYNEESSSSSLSNYSQTEDIHRMFTKTPQDNNHHTNSTQKYNETDDSSILYQPGDQRNIPERSQFEQYKKEVVPQFNNNYSQPHINKQQQQPITYSNDTAKTPSITNNQSAKQLQPNHSTSVITNSQSVSPYNQKASSLQKLKSQDIISSSEDGDGDSSLSEDSSYFSNEISNDLSQSDYSMHQLDLKKQQILQNQDKQQNELNLILKSSERARGIEITSSSKMSNRYEGQQQQYSGIGQSVVPQTFSFQKQQQQMTVSQERLQINTQGNNVRIPTEKFTFNEEINDEEEGEYYEQ